MRRHLRTLSVAIAGAALFAPLGLVGATPAASAAASVVGATGRAIPGPVNAGNTYRWGRIAQRYEFENRRLERYWHRSGPGQVRNQYGMLTLNTRTHGTLSATLGRRGHPFGRWETRMRAHRFTTGHGSYRVNVALVPAGRRAQHCSASDIGLTSYVPDRDGPATWTTRHRPNLQHTFTKAMSFAPNEWHTFGVEVRPHRIAWFVDARSVSVLRVRHPSRVPLTVRFTMAPTTGGTLDASRMQMDWLRY